MDLSAVQLRDVDIFRHECIVAVNGLCERKTVEQPVRIAVRIDTIGFAGFNETIKIRAREYRTVPLLPDTANDSDSDNSHGLPLSLMSMNVRNFILAH
jgi:hypothetical protein